jgi:hypothetical protein
VRIEAEPDERVRGSSLERRAGEPEANARLRPPAHVDAHRGDGDGGERGDGQRASEQPSSTDGARDGERHRHGEDRARRRRQQHGREQREERPAPA